MLFRFPKFTSVTIIQELPFALIPNKSPRIRFSHVASIKNHQTHDFLQHCDVQKNPSIPL